MYASNGNKSKVKRPTLLMYCGMLRAVMERLDALTDLFDLSLPRYMNMLIGWYMIPEDNFVLQAEVAFVA